MSAEFVLEECCVCGVNFCISAGLGRNLKETKAKFFCPNGHSQSYTKSTSDILRSEIQVKDRIISNLESDLAKALKRKKK